jgi:hypothetical protein
MPQLAKYLLATGAIVGVWESNTEALIEAQRVEEDVVYGYLAVDLTDVGNQALQDGWYVHEELLLEKNELTLSATPSPFTADGVEVCTISVTPFVPCVLLVNGTPLEVSEGDEDITLTADVPETFVVVLEPLAAYWATPLTVEAI